MINPTIQAISTFDTGSGGIIHAKMLAENGFPLVYCFIDPLYAPYGDKNDGFIMSRLLSFSQYMDENFKGPVLGVVACNTASTVLDKLKEGKLVTSQKIEFVSVIDPMIEETRNHGKLHSALRECDSKLYIAVIGTKKTIESNFYQERLQKALPNADVRGVASPDLATLIDTGASDEDLNISIEEAVDKIVSTPHSKILPGADVIVALACTHYQQVEEIFEKCFREKGIHPHILDQPRLMLGYLEKYYKDRLLDLRSQPPRETRLVICTTEEQPFEKTRLMVEKIFPPKGYVDGKGRYRLGLNNIGICPVAMGYKSLPINQNRQDWPFVCAI